MPVKNFKFVSPGVFINEIDNSFRPRKADAIGPVVIGRSTRGLAMQPVTVQSYSDFVTQFGGTVAGMGGGDISRDGNYQSPMYGTYAAKAFLNANVAPLTFVRLLGQQSTNNDGTDAAKAGWKTTNTPADLAASNGGAYGLWVFKSGSSTSANPEQLATGSLAAVWYLDSGYIQLRGTIYAGDPVKVIPATGAAGTLITSDSDGLFTAEIYNSTDSLLEKVKFNFDDSKETFIRKRFNTNPQVGNANATDFYPAASVKNYWLGETFEQELRDGTLSADRTDVTGDLTTEKNLVGIILPIEGANNPSNLKGQASREATAGWFIGQDLGVPASYNSELQQKLFRLIGRGHGEWLHKNAKVSIEKVRESSVSTSDYGTFSLVIRSLHDTDNNVVVLERFDNLTLDPSSVDYVARRIGDRYQQWDSTERRLREYGDYPNQSRYVRVEMNTDVDAGATDPVLLPFGYFGPPKLKDTGLVAAKATTFGTGIYIKATDTNMPNGGAGALGNATATTGINVTSSLIFPTARLRLSASDGGLSNPANAYFGLDNTRNRLSTRADRSIGDFHRLIYTSFPDDPTGQEATLAAAGVDAYAYVFSLNDVTSSAQGKYYLSGSRTLAVNPLSASQLLDDGVDRFTAPFWGGFDGFDITKPDPTFNSGMISTSTEDNNYIYHTYQRAIDTVSDPEFINMNLLTVPGLTQESLTTHMINVCEDRADAMALIDLPSVYMPPHEKRFDTAKERLGTTPLQAARALKDRRIDSSYGATFYPWVQTRDETNGQLVWIPPTVAMMGVLASSEKSTQVWFAPAGFNRGGLSDGAAGIPVTNVTERLTSKDRDTLYESRINPIASFPSTGIVVFGQKTLQERPSALDRINVRRLVIFLKKNISVLSSQVLFEQNVQATWNRFKSLIEPFLSNVQTEFGITDYRLILDETTTTPDLIDQNVLYAKIMVKPARAIEYIAIDFVVASTGASFDD
jgi:hypothetical protein